MFCLDLDELQHLDRSLATFSYNRANLYALNDRDHLRTPGSGLKQSLIHYLKSQGDESPVGRIMLVTNLRVWGYVFNPVSFYFVYSPDESLHCVVAEVANTFNEQKLYLVRGPRLKDNRATEALPKQFYISPFSELDTRLEFDLNSPGTQLDLRISESDASGRFFHSALKGERKRLSNRSLIQYTFRFPFMTAQVMAAIHWQAARMALKRIPYFRKNEHPELQTEVRPYLEAERTSAL